MKETSPQNNTSEKTPWTKEEFDAMWENMVLEDVQPILIVLARRPHGYRMEALLRIFPYDGPQKIRGRLTTLNRIHKQHRDKPRLFHSDRRGNVFTMDPAVAALIRQQDARWVPLPARVKR